MMVLLDTNVLVYAADRQSPHYGACRRLRNNALQGRLQACISSTVLTEFYGIVTDKNRVSQPLSSQVALQELRAYSQAFPTLYPTTNTMDALERLLRSYDIKGALIFDAFIIATMLSHGVETIYTFNVKDFRRFKEIQAKRP